MIQAVAKLGSQSLILSADNLVELAEKVNDINLMNYRLAGVTDAVLRFRKNDGGDFTEMYSPSLSASKTISKKLEGDDVYIGADTPWVRFFSEDESYEVRYDTLTDQLAGLGWVEADLKKFHKAKKCKSQGAKGKTRAWTYQKLP